MALHLPALRVVQVLIRNDAPTLAIDIRCRIDRRAGRYRFGFFFALHRAQIVHTAAERIVNIAKLIWLVNRLSILLRLRLYFNHWFRLFHFEVCIFAPAFLQTERMDMKLWVVDEELVVRLGRD